MTAGHWRRISDIFAEALDQPAADRATFLDKACDGNPELRKEVEAMLVAEEVSLGFLEEPAPRAQIPGELPGGWRLIEKIGEGGMGTVYRAEKKFDGIIQPAAVKLLAFAHLTPELIRRFKSERRILAGLQHPNITRLIDGGSSDGVPFLVMELIEGQPLLDYCRASGRSMRQRLSLFLKICAAVDYAHQMLVVHRDIKPSNILVTADGEPKLLDFGIAKLLESEVDRESRTITLYRALSINYASPEQLRGEHASTSTDVYSLGALLFEMLTGERRDFGELTTPEAVARQIEEQPMPKPSSFRKGISQDLDAIVEKATRPEAAARYLSVAQFAADIQRHLDGLPVAAQKGTWRYRAGKFLARNKLGIAVAMTFAAGLGAFGWAAWQTAEARHRAEKQLAETRAIAGMMAMNIPGRIIAFPGSLPLRRRMASYGLAYLDQQFADRDPADAKQRRQLALGYFNIGNALGAPTESNLGDFDEAARCYRRVLDLYFEGSDPRHSDPDTDAAIGLTFTRRIETLLRVRRPADALQAAEECIVRARQGNHENVARVELSCRASRLRALADLGQPVGSGEVDGLLQSESELDDELGSLFARISNKYLAARLSLQKKDYAKAIELAKSGLDLTAGKTAIRPNLQRGRILVVLAKAEAALGDTSRAASRFDECLQVLRELTRHDREDVEPRAELARSLVESLEMVAGDPSLTNARLVEAESLVRGILQDVSYPAARFLLVRILAAQANLRNDCNLREAALAEFDQLVASQRTLPTDIPVVDEIRARRCAPRKK